VEPEPGRHPLLERLHARRERHLERSRAYRTALAVVGFAVLGAGVALLVLPGPGLLVIAFGLGLLALEFAWAERALEQAVKRMEVAKRTATRASGVQKALGLLVVVLAGAALVAAMILWEVPILPF
jgi:uncharacterized protein (TIGR02611 family)